jgi:sigma-B regulation protein RsbU (phosphoserine phosphatase)
MKNLMESLSPRVIRVLYSVATFFVLMLTLSHALDVLYFSATSNDQCGWLARKGKPGVEITQVVPGGVTDVAGVRNGDILHAINGMRFGDGQEAMRIINKVKLHDYVEYLLERDGSTFTTKVQVLKVFDIRYLANFLLGFGFLVVGYIVVLSRPQGKIQRMFAQYGILAMLLLGLSQYQSIVSQPWLYKTYTVALIIGWAFMMPICITFFLHFPVRLKGASWRWLKVLLYAVSILTVLPSAYRLVIGWPKEFPWLISIIVSNIPGVFFVSGLIVFVVTYFVSVERARRRQLRPMLAGVVIGILSIVYANVLQASNQFVLFTTPILLLPTLLVVLLPVSFGYSIFRYRLMDIDLVVKKSLLYAIVTALLAGLYLLLVYVIGTTTSYLLGTEESEVGNLFAFVVIAFTFDPLKRKAQDWIDRFFYQERYNYQRALLEFSQELPSKIHLDEILGSIISRISSTMHVEKMAVILCDDKEGCSFSAAGIDASDCGFDQNPDGLLALLGLRRSPQSFALLATEPEIYDIGPLDREKLVRSGVVLSVPMFLQGRLIGLINVGPKLSGKVYSQEDIDLLSTVGGQAAIAIENARLHQSEIEIQRFEKELALARDIQQSLLPKSDPVVSGLDISGVSIPALTVGGDYFDYIELGDGRLLVVVGDVSGKGVSAALYMSKIQGMIQVIAPMHEHPRDMLIQVNRRIYESIERKSFITMILALFDLRRKEVLICRAGHSKALIGVNGTLEYLRGGGIGLGLERGPVFEQELEEIRKPLDPNSLFVFYSDGLTEAMNDRDVPFGEETVFDIVKSKRSLTAQQLQQTILTSIEEHRGSAEQNDDLTVVVVKSAMQGI